MTTTRSVLPTGRTGTTGAVVGLVVAMLALLGTTVGAPPPASAAAAPPGVPWTWGGNTFGQLGAGTTQAGPTPGPVVGLTDVVDMHGGREHVIHRGRRRRHTVVAHRAGSGSRAHGSLSPSKNGPVTSSPSTAP